MASAEEYDKMTPEEREAKDKADREREAKEQAGVAHITSIDERPTEIW
jgi:hypothetical protein